MILLEVELDKDPRDHGGILMDLQLDKILMDL
jgi:hypothetical protein